MERRRFLSALAAATAAAAVGAELDWERLLWVPKPMVTVPAMPRVGRYARVSYIDVHGLNGSDWMEEHEVNGYIQALQTSARDFFVWKEPKAVVDYERLRGKLEQMTFRHNHFRAEAQKALDRDIHGYMVRGYASVMDYDAGREAYSGRAWREPYEGLCKQGIEGGGKRTNG